MRQMVGALGAATVMAFAVAPTTASAAGATVNLATSASFNTVLVDVAGFALYTLPTDHNGMSTCTGPCVALWPALTVPAATTPTAGTGVPGTAASVLQANGTSQVTYDGAPLYTYVGDTSPGQVSGNNVGGFTVVQVSGATTTPTTSAPAPTTGSTSPPTPTTAPPASSAPTTAPVKATAASTASTAAGTLAFTGPAPALLWMTLVGVALVVLSAVMLLLLGDGAGAGATRLGLGRARRVGSWFLGR